MLNKDSRFRKNPEFVFYYLWQKELRELSSGIYNVLKMTGKHGMSVKDFLKGVDSSNKQMEANLSIMINLLGAQSNTGFLRLRVMRLILNIIFGGVMTVLAY